MKDWIKIISSGALGAILTYFLSSGIFSSEIITLQMNRSTIVFLLIFGIYVLRVELELSQLRKNNTKHL